MLTKNQVLSIDALGNYSDLVKSYQNKKNIEFYDLSGSLIIPPFFDMHFHWVQDDVCLMPKDSLLEWLEKYTFPTEQKFANKRFVDRKSRILSN